MARPCHFPPLGHPRMVQASLGQVAKEFSSRFPSSLSCVCHVIYVDTCRHKISWIIVLFLVVKSWTPWLVCPDVFLVLVRTDDQLFINIVLFANLFHFSQDIHLWPSLLLVATSLMSGFSFCRSTIYIQYCSCSSKCWLCKQCPGFLFLSSFKSGPQLMCWCLHSCLPSFCSKKRPSSRVSSVFVRHMLFLFAFLFRIAQCMTQTCEDHCDLWVLWSSLYVNCALVTGKVFKRPQKPELAPGV